MRWNKYMTNAVSISVKSVMVIISVSPENTPVPDAAQVYGKSCSRGNHNVSQGMGEDSTQTKPGKGSSMARLYIIRQFSHTPRTP